MIQPEIPDLLHCHQDFAPLTGLCTPDISPQTPSAITISVYSSLLLHCCLSADLLLNPKDFCHQWGDKFLNGRGKKKAIFQHQVKFSQRLLPELLYPSSSPHALSLSESLSFSGGRWLWQVCWGSTGLETKLSLLIKPLPSPDPEQILGSVRGGWGGTFCHWQCCIHP